MEEEDKSGKIWTLQVCYNYTTALVLLELILVLVFRSSENQIRVLFECARIYLKDYFYHDVHRDFFT